LETIAAAVQHAPSPPLPRKQGREQTETASLLTSQSAVRRGAPKSTLPCAIAALIAASVATGAEAEAPRALDVPIVVGGEQLDACGGIAEVKRRALPVRSGPGPRYREIDRLRRGVRVYLCGEQGPWYAAIYSRKPGENCRIGEAYPKVASYSGPCRAGWIRARYVEIIAG
jgi:hypothetical protein